VSIGSLRIGCVKYLNAQPLVYGWPGKIVFDHPAALSEQLANGALDVALVSSFEFFRNSIYAIVDSVSIASDGPVGSVFLAHATDWSQINEIEMDPASLTSVNLLRCLLAEAEQRIPLVNQAGDKLEPLGTGKARLLIGDQAIHFRNKYGERYRYWDLGGEWQRAVGLPFVYALWLIRPEIENAPEIATRLREQRNANLADLDAVIAAQTEFGPEFCEYYYRHCLRFNLGSREKEGLHEFQALCQKHGLLPLGQSILQLV